MTQEISSLMDGELDAQEAGRAVQGCCASEEQKQTWYVYHAIGDAMRGHAPGRLDVPHRLIEALEDQPTVLAPRRRVVDAPFTRITLAAAASVATLGVVGWLGTQGGPLHGDPVVAKGAAGPVTVASAVPVATTQPVLNVQDYLVAHRQIPSPELYRQVSNQAPAAAR